MEKDASPDFLRAQATRFRRLTRDLTSRRDQRVLIDLAEDYDARAAEAERKAGEEP